MYKIAGVEQKRPGFYKCEYGNYSIIRNKSRDWRVYKDFGSDIETLCYQTNSFRDACRFYRGRPAVPATLANVEIVQQLKTENACAPGCEMRCRLCPNDLMHDAAALIEKLSKDSDALAELDAAVAEYSIGDGMYDFGPAEERRVQTIIEQARTRHLGRGAASRLMCKKYQKRA